MAGADRGGSERGPDLIHGLANAAPLVFLTNPPEGGTALEVRLEGSDSHRDARGAVVRVTVGDMVMTRLAGAVEPFQTGKPPWMYFGLAGASEADRVEVVWPDGSTDYATDVPAGHRVLLVQGEQ